MKLLNALSDGWRQERTIINRDDFGQISGLPAIGVKTFISVGRRHTSGKSRAGIDYLSGRQVNDIHSVAHRPPKIF
ncbi:hypothetical protein, partial [Pseudomonas syringae group genomosp. 7]|uniref:hypothetical protein n=1 Tax=Pseudomonas syringae group genomosp. 7 TaxID=251699 RepID=UPI00376F4F0F